MTAISNPWPSDWQSFYQLAAEEGWRVPQVERQLWLGSWAEHVHCLRYFGHFCGLVTAVPHQRSGWIGNLIVAHSQRGHGLGGRLFQYALTDLKQRGLERVWLTASEQGRPLYEKSGFLAVGQVERWIRPPGSIPDRTVKRSSTDSQQLRDYDRMAWGEERSALLDHLLSRGQVFGCRGSAILLQKGVDLQIIGPWYSNDFCLQTNHRLLLQVIAAADPDIELVADILAPSPVRQALVKSGFHCSSCNQLMVAGPCRPAASWMMLALASLGSIG